MYAYGQKELRWADSFDLKFGSPYLFFYGYLKLKNRAAMDRTDRHPVIKASHHPDP